MAMRVLAIETVGMTGSVAVLSGDEVLVERRLDTERRSAQTLAPAIQDLLAEVGWRPADLELVAVAQGPGSFTGLRIGITTAKGLAYVLGCRLLGVNTLRAIANGFPRMCRGSAWASTPSVASYSWPNSSVRLAAS